MRELAIVSARSRSSIWVMHDLPQHPYALCEGVMSKWADCKSCLNAYPTYALVNNLCLDCQCPAAEPITDAPAEQDECTCQDQPQYCEFCIKRIEAVAGLIRTPAPWEHDAIAAANVKAIFNLPIDNCVKPSPKPQTDPRSEGIARAINRLSGGYEPRLGCGVVEE